MRQAQNLLCVGIAAAASLCVVTCQPIATPKDTLSFPAEVGTPYLVSREVADQQRGEYADADFLKSLTRRSVEDYSDADFLADLQALSGRSVDEDEDDEFLASVHALGRRALADDADAEVDGNAAGLSKRATGADGQQQQQQPPTEEEAKNQQAINELQQQMASTKAQLDKFSTESDEINRNIMGQPNGATPEQDERMDALAVDKEVAGARYANLANQLERLQPTAPIPQAKLRKSSWLTRLRSKLPSSNSGDRKPSVILP